MRYLIRIMTGIMVLAMLVTGSGCRRQPAESVSSSSPPAAEPVYLPAEFNSQESLLLGGNMLAELYPQVLVDIIRAAHEDIGIVVLVKSDAEARRVGNLLSAANLPADAVSYLELPIRTMWVRDFGPVTVVDLKGRRKCVDSVYRQRRGNIVDNDVPIHFAQSKGLPLVECPLMLEGGDFLGNGLGLGLGSTRIINRNHHYLSLEPDEVARRLGMTLGFESVQFIVPLKGETTGHLDMFCAFLRPDLLVMGQYDRSGDPENAAILDQGAASLSGLPTKVGPLEVVRIPMPPHTDGIWRTYTNIVFANGKVLVPVYPDFCPQMDQEALALYRQWLPDREIVGIDASGLISMRGSLRCITMNIPEGLLPDSKRFLMFPPK